MRILDATEVDRVSAGGVRAAIFICAGLVSLAMDATDKATEFWAGVKQGYKDGDAGDQ